MCVVCNKTVYANEEVKLGENTSYHQQCFRCAHCNKIVQSTNYSQYNGVIYCKPHFISLFKQRGKYDDLASGDKAPAPRPAAEQKVDLSATMPVQSSLNAASPRAGKKDLVSVLRTRNAAAVQGLIEKKGLGIIFKAGADGVSPLELAFSSNNSECGRVMLKAIEDALNSGSYAMEKLVEDEKDEPVAAPAPAARGRLHSAADAPVPNVVHPARAVAESAKPAEVLPEAPVQELEVKGEEPARAAAPAPAEVEAHIPVLEIPEVRSSAPAAAPSPSYLKGASAQSWLDSPMQSLAQNA
eukprot:TRINITY_DN16901_c0_g1_i1.p1 TRINITY_DN16901_c0_g1~~TRINITY_DN16901_c0_g1_i1.p1  ORF type:complete len:330 (+),score=83.11 TRINITY_DN16901_c0_g1_i1:99-992(+)